jgi:ligand-binding sensor domain-containing protein
LGRFDGTRFTTFNTANTTNLTSDAVATVYEDREGMLWIGTTGGGLVHYANGRLQAVKLRADTRSELVEQILEDKNGILWALTSHALFKRKDGSFSQHPLASGVISSRTYLMAIAPARDGTLWLGTSAGLCWVRDGAVGAVGYLTNRSVWSLALEKTGALWCGGAGEPGLQRIDAGGMYHHPAFVSNTVDCVHAAQDGSVWVGTREGTLWRLKGQEATLCFAAPGGSSQRIQSITDDRDGNIWFGARASGLSRLAPKRVVTRSKRDGLPSDEVTCLCEDSKGQMLLGTFGNGVHWVTGSQPGPIDPKLATGEIATMVSMQDGSILIGGFYGTVWRWRDGQLVTEGHYPSLQVMLEDREKRLWIGTRERGVIGEDHAGRKLFSTTEGLSHNRVYCMAEDASGAIWVGTEHGVNRIRNGRVEAFGREDGLPAELFQAIWTESDGTVWIGSTGGGLVRWRDGRFATLTTRQGLINDSIEQILGDGSGNIWIGTQLGLMRVSLRDLNNCADKKQSFLHGKVLNRDDGLLVPNCGTEYNPSCLKAHDGRLWFGMRSGLLIVDPTRLGSQTNPPPVYIEEMFADGTPMSGRSVIPPATHNLKIQFTALDLSAPRKVRFRLRLDGYDQAWTEAGSERVATYTKVPPGDYVFHVSACNSDGVWNEVGASLAFTVAPEWWQTWWARGSAALIIFGLVLSYDRRRVRRLERRRAEQEIFARRLIDSQESERRRIASELHDSLGQNLLIIKNRAFIGMKTTASPVAMREQLNEISEASAHSIEEVRTIARCPVPGWKTTSPSNSVPGWREESSGAVP